MKKNIVIGIFIISVCLCCFNTWNKKNSNFYSPYNEEKFLDIENIEYPEFSYLLETYLKLEKPGLMFLVNRTENEDLYESIGNDTYQMKATIMDVSNQKEFYTRPNNIEFTVERSLLTFEEFDGEYHLSNDFEEFIIPEKSDNDNIEQSTAYQKIINANSDIDVSISFKDYISLEDLTAMMQSCDNTRFIWVAMDHVDRKKIYPIGLSLLEECYSQKWTVEANQLYPHLSLQIEDIFDAQKLHQSYLSKLKLLKDHASFLDLMNNTTLPHYIQSDIIDDLCNRASKQSQCYGIRLKTDSQNVIALIDQWDISHLYIHE